MSTPLRHVKLISLSPTHRVSVLPYIDSHSRFHKRESMSDEIRQPHDRQPPFDAAATVRAAEGLAGAAGLEPTTCGFGDRRSTN